MPALVRLQPAELDWDAPHLPRSRQYGEGYFGAEDGLAEAEHVFLRGNDLPQRWRALPPQAQFTLAETGFGSGMNLLAAARLWQQVAPVDARLHFISSELHPMHSADLERVHRHWPPLAKLAARLRAAYPPMVPGWHRFHLDAQISVTLIFAEVESALAGLCPTLAGELWDHQNWGPNWGPNWGVDAWFLDGFAPARNPAMWRESVFALMRRLSRPGASAATFSCAGAVRRGLQKWGFATEKVAGFGRKRQMLRARFDPAAAVDLADWQRIQAGQNTVCWHLSSTRAPEYQQVAIVGGGIAGCATAMALARRGIAVSLFEAGELAGGASGNPQAALHARLSAAGGMLRDFGLHALNYALRFYAEYLESPEQGVLCGLIQLPRSAADLAQMGRIAERFRHAPELVRRLDAAALSALAGLKIGSGGLYFPGGGWVCGPRFCRALLHRSGARLIEHTAVTAIAADSDRYILRSDRLELGTFDAVVLCNAMQARALSQASWLPLRPIRGQLSRLRDCPETGGLRTVLCRDNYLCPAVAGAQTVGATYAIDSDSTAVTRADYRANMRGVQALLGLPQPLNHSSPDLSTEHPPEMGDRAAIRATAPDYLPLVGALPDKPLFLQEFAAWRKNLKQPIARAHGGYAGLYANLGHGSHGFVYAPLCAELLAAQLAGEPPPLAAEMQRALHPARFLVRALARNGPLSVA